MARQWLHCIDQDGLHAFAAIQGKLRPVQVFPGNEEGVARFRQWLRDDKVGGLHTILADLADEGFHSESLPHAMGQDRRAMLRRRMAQHFFGTPYTTALSLGRESSGRRDERILYAAITRPTAVEPWLSAMREHPLAISALLTPALLLRQLLDSVKPESKRGLLIALSHTGIRQIYFDEGRLRFARLSPAPEGPFSRWAPDCVREAQKTYQYLTAQRWLQRGSTLPVWVLLHQDDITPFVQDLPASDAMQFIAVNLAAATQHSGLRLPLASSDSRPLFMHMALREAHTQQLAPEADRRFYKQWQLRTAAIAVGAVIFSACALLALKFQVDSYSLRQESAQHQAEEALYQTQYRQLMQTLPDMPADLEQINALIGGYDRLLALPAGPRQAMLSLSQIMERFPEIELQRLEWQLGDKDLKLPPLATSPLVQTLQIFARLPDAAATDPRSAITRIRDFAAALQATGSGSAVLTRLPFDVESDKILRSNSAESNKPIFELRWTLQGNGT